MNMMWRLHPRAHGLPRLFMRYKHTEKIFNMLISGNRGTLASAITLVESTKSSHKKQADELMTRVLRYLKSKPEPSFRIGLSGAPGAGKSTVVETLGMKLTKEGHRVAVLAIDPSSVRTGGSLLGDRTRMVNLSRNSNAYIRPSPTSGTLGGVAKKTNEAVILCEAAGYDVVFVETVGIGQSEIAVADMVDMFVLVIPPASGDELQGIKKGVVEVADLVLVNKADGDLLPAARRIQGEYASALKLLHHGSADSWRPRVYPVSALDGTGFDQVWEKMHQFKKTMLKTDRFHAKRKDQYKSWMWNYIRQDIMDAFRANPDVRSQIQTYERLVENEQVTPNMAAKTLLEIFGQKYSNS